jgi:hypothetical protein
MSRLIFIAVAFIAGAAVTLASLRLAPPSGEAHKIEARIGRYQLHHATIETMPVASGPVVKGEEVFLLDTATGLTYRLNSANPMAFVWEHINPGDALKSQMMK